MSRHFISRFSQKSCHVCSVSAVTKKKAEEISVWIIECQRKTVSADIIRPKVNKADYTSKSLKNSISSWRMLCYDGLINNQREAAGNFPGSQGCCPDSVFHQTDNAKQSHHTVRLNLLIANNKAAAYIRKKKLTSIWLTGVSVFYPEEQHGTSLSDVSRDALVTAWP